MAKNVILTNEGTKQFNHAIELLKTSIKEINQVADQMVPENLILDGLSNYLSDFCKSMEADSKLKIVFTTEGEIINADEHIDTTIFRCFRILIFTILKYSTPDTIYINLLKSGNAFNLTIKDNSTFNIFKAPNYNIKQDLENVKSILAPFNGNLYFKTAESNNNEIVIQIPI